MEGGDLTDLDVATDAIVLEPGHSGLGTDLLDLGTGQEAVRMIGVIKSQVERSGALEVWQGHAGVRVVFLGEHGF